MKKSHAITIIIACCSIHSSATTVIPFNPRAVSIDYGMGRMAIFTYEPSEIEREMHRTQEDRAKAAEERRKEVFSFNLEEVRRTKEKTDPWQPGTKVVKVEFIFSDNRKAEITGAAIKDIDLTDLTDSQIESMAKNGNWSLTVRIKNLQTIPRRTADDRVVFIFEDYEYKERWLRIDGKTFFNK